MFLCEPLTSVPSSSLWRLPPQAGFLRGVVHCPISSPEKESGLAFLARVLTFTLTGPSEVKCRARFPFGAVGKRGGSSVETTTSVPSARAMTVCVLRVTLQGNGPLAEIEFWRERNATLSALHEQTKLPIVRKVLDVIKESDSMLVANLQPVLTELFKLHMEASDNVRFLSTVERHFKVGRACCALESRACKLALTRI